MKGRIFKSVAVALFALASQMAHAGTVTYVYTDPQGTPLAEANVSGTITATFDYKPYGSQALGSPKAGPGYTGHVNDPDTGFVYMQARYYDPMAGRFLSVDPANVSAGTIFYFDRYDYAKNNPIANTDPSGMCADYYENGGCKVAIKDPIKQDGQAKDAQKAIEKVLNDNDKKINNLSDNARYSYIAKNNFSGFKGSLTGKEIKKIWNNQHFSIVPNGTKFGNGGAGGATSGGNTALTPDAISAWAMGSPGNGVSSIVFHELAHETEAGKDARRGNEGDSAGPRFEERERKVQSIGGAMAGSVEAPFSCAASSLGCE